MILVDHYAICSDSKKYIHKTLSGRNHSVPSCALAQRLLFQCLLPFPSVILCCISAQTLAPATTCSYRSLHQVWQAWAYSLVFVQPACWHKLWSGGQPWRFSPFHRRTHCWCAHTSFLANFQCSHRVVLVPFCIIYSLHLIAAWFLQAIWPVKFFFNLRVFIKE